jgi:nucleoside phosphorylase
MIICAGESESFEFATPMGIGLIDTAINLTKRCIKNPPKSILFVGSAGSYGEYEIFDIVESSSASNIENSFFNANAYTPIKSIIKSTDEIIINSSNYITTDITLSKEYLSKGISLENMEFYAVLKVAKAFKIPARGVFIVTNRCDKNAHADFIKNHKEAMSRIKYYMSLKHL